jgi:integrase
MSGTTSEEQHPALPIYRLFSGGVEPDEDAYELDSKTWATWRRYRAAYNSYVTFCEETGVQPFPASAATVRPFVRHVVKTGGAVVSCDITRQVIMMVHKLRGYPPVVWDSMDLFYQGVRRRHGGPRRQAQPLRTEDLQSILGRLDPASPRGARDGAILALGWAGALRSEEITRLAWDAAGLHGKGHIVTRPAGVEIHFRRTKTDQTGREAQQVIIPAPDVPLVAAWLGHWERIAGRVPGRLIFMQVSRSDRIIAKPMAPTAVTAVVRKNVLRFLLAAGMEEVAAVALASCYRSHSLRAGYASSASAGGVVEAEIREHCRHRSAETTARYIRIGRKWEAGGLKGLLPDGGRGGT